MEIVFTIVIISTQWMTNGLIILQETLTKLQLSFQTFTDADWGASGRVHSLAALHKAPRGIKISFFFNFRERNFFWLTLSKLFLFSQQQNTPLNNHLARIRRDARQGSTTSRDNAGLRTFWWPLSPVRRDGWTCGERAEPTPSWNTVPWNLQEGRKIKAGVSPLVATITCLQHAAWPPH